jgi:hypothetical protein
MNKNKLAIIAYFAGVLDGEGCLMIHRPHGNFNYFSMRIEISQKEGKLIDFLVGNFGGSVRDSMNGYKGVWKWQLCGDKAIELLKESLSYLIVKKKQAEVVIRWSDHHKKKKLKLENEDYLELRKLKTIYATPRSVNMLGAETKQIELDGKYSIPLVSDSPFQREKKPLVIG